MPTTASSVARVNGIELGYQIVGEGAPLLLLHGGFGSVEMFGLLGGGLRDASWDRSGMTHHRLAILPGVTHYDINVVPALSAAIIPFLDQA
jgi:pimeloyl-ACP methyl ester carboxylesterase